MSDRSDLCCNLHAMTAGKRQRYQSLRSRLEASVTGVEEIENGYVLQLRRSGLSADELAEWVELERKCCPFLELIIDPATAERPLSLRVTGREGVKAFIRAEFSALNLP